jgi:hypothetical protein
VKNQNPPSASGNYDLRKQWEKQKSFRAQLRGLKTRWQDAPFFATPIAIKGKIFLAICLAKTLQTYDAKARIASL